MGTSKLILVLPEDFFGLSFVSLILMRATLAFCAE